MMSEGKKEIGQGETTMMKMTGDHTEEETEIDTTETGDT